tara:strand:+ start:380 stop:640 length:261 start_codon:yes stop_codon:yes gene_type:complete
MFSLYLLIPISLLFVVLAVSIFCWAVNEGQYDDLDSEGQRILFDEEDCVRKSGDLDKRQNGFLDKRQNGCLDKKQGGFLDEKQDGA